MCTLLLLYSVFVARFSMTSISSLLTLATNGHNRPNEAEIGVNFIQLFYCKKMNVLPLLWSHVQNIKVFEVQIRLSEFGIFVS